MIHEAVIQEGVSRTVWRTENIETCGGEGRLHNKDAADSNRGRRLKFGENSNATRQNAISFHGGDRGRVFDGVLLTCLARFKQIGRIFWISF